MIYKIKSNIIRRAVLLIAVPVIIAALLTLYPIVIMIDGLRAGPAQALEVMKRKARWAVGDFPALMLCAKKCWRGEDM